MRMGENEIQDMLKAYPELNYQREEDKYLFQGMVSIYHKEDKSNLILSGDFGIKIVVSDYYPKEIPVIYDTNKAIDEKYIHRYADGELCLESTLRLQLFCKEHTVKEFVDFFLIQYLCSYLYYKRYLKYPYGERPHGVIGEYDFLQEYFGIPIAKVPKVLSYIITKGVRRNDMCPCGSGKFIKRCHGNKMIVLLNGIENAKLKELYSDLQEIIRRDN